MFAIPVTKMVRKWKNPPLDHKYALLDPKAIKQISCRRLSIVALPTLHFPMKGHHSDILGLQVRTSISPTSYERGCGAFHISILS